MSGVRCELTPEDVITAYQETGVVPRSCCIGRVSGNTIVACGAGVIGLHQGLWTAQSLKYNDEGKGTLYERLYDAYGREYIGAWTNGFDTGFCPDQEFCQRYDSVAYRQGFKTGRAVAAGIPPLQVPDYPPNDLVPDVMVAPAMA